MARTSWGGHGKVCLRQNGIMMMTIRPEPFVGGARDIAMLLGKELDITHPYSGNRDGTYREGTLAIQEWESENGVLTQKKALDLISDAYYLACYELGSDTHDFFQEDNQIHLALLDLVFRLWPAFKEPTDACEA